MDVCASPAVVPSDENATCAGSVSVMVSAVLAGTTGTASPVSGLAETVVHGAYGDLHIKAIGVYSYTPNNTAAEALGEAVAQRMMRAGAEELLRASEQLAVGA